MPLNPDEQKEFLISRIILGLFKKLGPLVVKDHLSAQAKQLPASENPYRIPSLSAVYVG